MRRIYLQKAKTEVARSNTIHSINRQIVLNYVREREPISRAEIATLPSPNARICSTAGLWILCPTSIMKNPKPRFMSLDGATLEGAKLPPAFQLTTRGIPQIYYSEELAWRGGHEPASRQDFRGGWNSDLRNAFTENGTTVKNERV